MTSTTKLTSIILCLVASALLALAAACSGTEPTATPDASPTTVSGSGTATPTASPTTTASPTETPVAPTATREPTPTATTEPVDIDLSGLDAVEADAASASYLGEMDGLSVGEFDLQTEYMSGIEAPTEVTMPEIEFTLDLP